MDAASSASASLEPLLDVDEIQGNILGGFNTDYQIVWTFACSEARSLRELIHWVAQDVTTVRTMEGRRRERREESRRTRREAAPSREVRLCVGLSFVGLSKLQPDSDQFKDAIFRGGMNLTAASRLGDPQGAERGNPQSWKVGGGSEAPDGILVLACDCREPLDERRHALDALFARLGVQSLTCDVGADPSTFSTDLYTWPSGIEHFGFKDGIAQPAVRGRIDDQTFLVTRALPEPTDPTAIAYAAPGKPLVWPGAFVIGYPTQSQTFPPLSSPAWALGGTSGVAPAWAKNGAFLVFRRLAQDVPLFNRFLVDECQRLSTSGDSGVTPDVLGALVVGRWRSGAPLMRAPLADSPDLGRVVGANDAFAYLTSLEINDGFPAGNIDPGGVVCPFSGHIRKVNPRDRTTDLGNPADTLHRRILRRGIPFGEPLPIGATSDRNNNERGLLFLAFMTSIRDQFELLASDWMNDDKNPGPTSVGVDMLVGQGKGVNRARSATISHKGEIFSVSNADTSYPDWVYPTGGGYFFAPSRSAIRMLGSPSASG